MNYTDKAITNASVACFNTRSTLLRYFIVLVNSSCSLLILLLSTSFSSTASVVSFLLEDFNLNLVFFFV